MQTSEKILQCTYALSIGWLSYIVITSIAQFTQLQSANLFVFLGTIGAILALFGLFKFKSGLRAGLL
ncbi:MAG TPA: hypothetical protein VLG50_03785, partial [Candidatus Saccharimonadales bacterium]|nr:hypothetical protein [Candidatus Saccharimonadales bacterium]